MNIKIFVKSLLAGLAISLSAAIYLSVENIIIGGLLFSIGLLSIYLFDWSLYTGKACYFVDDVKHYTPIIICTFIGNLIGTVATGYLLRISGLTYIVEHAVESVNHKLDHSQLQYFILAIFCGICMSIAVLGYSKQKDDFGRFIIILLPITLFIVAKFEHVVANMFYLSISNKWSLETVVFLLICALGNLVGCSIIPLCNKVIKAKS